ncbi:tetratricopeptide repeat protein [Sulfurimonas sp.]|uniref:tetratricopeptide repeat protein n=1 Tax=Sulfurimonas sp. TaxID=2022749 RepID=UPI0019DBE3A1|nr:tetratricopeptide repeat protein [Sulfurimonas sp.]MBE0515700.1 hypothetical protein [Sulfurimonas sp.]
MQKIGFLVVGFIIFGLLFFGFDVYKKNIQGQAHISQKHAMVQIEDGNFTKAKKLLNESIELYPSSLVYETLGDIFLFEGNRQFAMNNYNLAKILCENKCDETLIVISSYMNEPNSTKTKENLRKLILYTESLIKLSNNKEIIYFNLGKYYLVQGDVHRAIKMFEEANHLYRYKNQTSQKDVDKIILLLTEEL